MQVDDLKIPFVIGVSGRMTLPVDDRPLLLNSFRQIVNWLRAGNDCGELTTLLGKSPKLGNDVPILLLSSLAPGVDQWIAAEAHDNLGIQVKAPLPYPPELYAKASTFTRYDQAGNEKADNPQRLDDYQAALARLPDDHSFHVSMPGDIPLSDKDLLAKLTAEVTRPKNETASSAKARRLQQNLRYRAAGEYVSAYCDLLLAFTDYDPTAEETPERSHGLPNRAQSGTDWIVESHLTGRRAGILPIRTPISSDNNGPVLRVWTRRKKDAKTDHLVGTVNLFTPKGCPPCDESFFLPPEIELARLNAQVASLKLFHRELKKHWEQGGALNDSKIDNLYKNDYPLEGKTPFFPKERALASDTSKSAPIEFFRKAVPKATATLGQIPKLKKLLVLRRVVANLNRQIDSSSKNVRRNLFILAIIVLLLLQLPALLSWGNPVTGDSSSYGILTLVVMFILAGGWTYYMRSSWRRLFDLQNDTRAGAEALRVQHYWIASGTGASVASQFLQRARGGVSWIRSLVSAHAFPYEESAAHFRELVPPEQREILERVRNGWICEQEHYFGKTTHAFYESRLTWSWAARTCLWAALTLTLFVGKIWIIDRPAIILPILLVGAIIFLGRFFLTSAAWEECAASNQIIIDAVIDRVPERKHPLGRLVRFILTTKQTFNSCRDDRYQPPTPNSNRPALEPEDENLASRIIRYTAWRHRRAISVSWQLPLIGGILLGITLWTSASALLVFFGQDAAFVTTLGGVLRNLLYGASGLSVSWMTTRFLTENINRYRSMRDVFAGARQRMDILLAELENPSADQPYQETLSEIHDLLRSLGNEAVYENADWLQMHRNNPIQPVFPNVS